MGILVKTAQRLENEVGRTREQLEPRLRVKLKKAKADWFELRARTNAPVVTRAELLTRAFLVRTDQEFRIFLDRLVGRMISELERVRRTLPRK